MALGMSMGDSHTSVVAAVLLFGLFSLVLGVWLSSRVLRPVTDLARRLRDFRRVGKAEALAPHFADDEVGELAVALDEDAGAGNAARGDLAIDEIVDGRKLLDRQHRPRPRSQPHLGRRQWG